MMKRLSVTACLLLVAAPLVLQAQNTIQRWDSVRVMESSTLLRNPTSGGFNVPEFSPIDLDQDGTLDLFVFDRSGHKVVTFVNAGTPGQIDYDFAPEYVSAFPSGITDFALCRDFNCDGKQDLFFGTQNGVKVYQNTSTPGNLNFTLFADTLFTDYGAGPAFVYLYQGDLPDFVDVDGDSDLDMLAFNAGGTVMEWHKNMSMENHGDCSHLELIAADRCWGNFQESGLNQTLTLGFNCRYGAGNGEPGKPSLHSGSTVAAFDEEADGDYELVIGDLLYNGLTYTHNAGTPTDAEVDSIDIIFPSYNASVELEIFAAGYFLDVDNDAKIDMLAAPNGTNTSVNYDNSWFYKNIAPGNGVLLERESKNFLTSEMIDVGLCAYPVFFDHDADGLLDLIVGNYSRKTSSSNLSSGLVLYRNTGTATAPEFTLTSRNYANLTNAFNPAIFGMTPAFGDMDGDGDLDLFIGDADGKVHYAQNTAPTGQVANFPNVVASYSGIDVGQFAAPAIADVDRDGDNDLIVGEMGGNLNYFPNTGTAQVPVIASLPADANWGLVDTEPICCTGFSIPNVMENPNTGRWDLIVGSEKGDFLYYRDFESELGDTFTLDEPNFGNTHEGERTAIAGADLNADGILEWVVGNVRGGLGFFKGNGPMAGIAPEIAAHTVAWKAFPNPTTGKVTVQLENAGAGTMKLSVTNVNGQEVMAKDHLPAHQGCEIDLSALGSGIYFLRMDMNGAFAGVRRLNILR